MSNRMRQLNAFTILSLDGYFAGPNGEIDWFKTNDEEDNRFSREHADPTSALVFGRTTYEMMKSFWPTPFAIKTEPVMAGVLNNNQKIVFSRTMEPVKDGPVWKHVRVIRDLTPESVMNLKKEQGGEMTILGSGTIVRQARELRPHRRVRASCQPDYPGGRQAPVPGREEDEPEDWSSHEHSGAGRSI